MKPQPLAAAILAATLAMPVLAEQDDGLLVAVANVTGEDISSTLTVDLTGLDLPPDTRATIYDPLTGTEETVALKPNEPLPVTVKAWMMLLVQVGGPQ